MNRYAFLTLAVLAGCSGGDYTPMNFHADGDRIVAIGVIDGGT